MKGVTIVKAESYVVNVADQQLFFRYTRMLMWATIVKGLTSSNATRVIIHASKSILSETPIPPQRNTNIRKHNIKLLLVN